MFLSVPGVLGVIRRHSHRHGLDDGRRSPGTKFLFVVLSLVDACFRGIWVQLHEQKGCYTCDPPEHACAGNIDYLIWVPNQVKLHTTVLALQREPERKGHMDVLTRSLSALLVLLVHDDLPAHCSLPFQSVAYPRSTRAAHKTVDLVDRLSGNVLKSIADSVTYADCVRYHIYPDTLCHRATVPTPVCRICWSV